MRQSPNSEYKDSPGIWMIHIVEEIKLLLFYNLLYIYIYIYINKAIMGPSNATILLLLFRC
jgi:hypothetical protein